MTDTIYVLQSRAEELNNYLEGLVRRESTSAPNRFDVMHLVHRLNEAYVAWADEIDKELAGG